MSGGLGTNPFHIRRQGRNYLAPNYGGTLVKFTTMEQGFIAAAKALKYMAGAFPKSYGFGDILISLRSGSAGEFLNAVALSYWSSYTTSQGERLSSHYGLKIDYVTGKVSGTNKLLSTYSSYTGMITPEAEAAAAAEKAKQDAERRKWEAEERARKAALAKYRRRPKQLNAPVIGRDYLDPYQADRLYDERHPPYELPE
jgi:hypothetical protein